MSIRDLDQMILAYVTQRQAAGQVAVGSRELTEQLDKPRATINRHLMQLVHVGKLLRVGRGPSTVFSLTVTATQTAPTKSGEPTQSGPTWDAAALKLRATLELPLGQRKPVSYRREFVDRYQPNESTLLPAALASTLAVQGRLIGQQPAGTYARRVLEQLLIDLSWQSSRLEGNRKSLLDTGELFLRGRSAGDDSDATMLLNHKDAIEFMVDAVPTYGITLPVIRNIQSMLMNGLLEDSSALGSTRRTVVDIADTVYVPTQMPAVLEEMLAIIVEKARAIRNPVECAFFLWVNVAYLQFFQDGNKRTSRLCSNLPLLLSNCAPLSFLNVEPLDYALAMIGIYEQQDVSLAVGLFDWTYRRSIDKYRAVLESLGAPDPLRAKYREELGDAVRQIVGSGTPLVAAVQSLHIADEHREAFIEMLSKELNYLEPYNCARYRLNIGLTEKWVAKGRPS
jgi:Fic/DOC family